MTILQGINKILIIRLRFMGDVLLTTPVIKSLHVNYPDAYISYLTEKNYFDVLSGNPYINEILTLDTDNKFLSQLELIMKIRKEKFDLVIDLFGNPRSALITFLSKARYRLGFEFRGRKYAYNIISDEKNIKSIIDVYLNTLKKIGIDHPGKELYFPITPQYENYALKYFSENSINSDKLIVGLNPGASHPSKQWGDKKFALLAEKLIERYNAQLIIFEGPKEKKLAGEIAKLINKKVSIAKDINLKQLGDLIKKCKVFITNDAGPMHIAAAVGTKTIALFGQGEPEIWFPYEEKNKFVALHEKVECSPCHLDICNQSIHKCMDLITVDKVIEAFDKLIK